MTETFDVLIVGGGSAGAVLANRLSEGGTRRIMVLEAGAAYSPNRRLTSSLGFGRITHSDQQPG